MVKDIGIKGGKYFLLNWAHPYFNYYIFIYSKLCHWYLFIVNVSNYYIFLYKDKCNYYTNIKLFCKKKKVIPLLHT